MSILDNFFENKRNDNLFNTCSFLLKAQNIKHSNLHLQSLLMNHINYSSLLAIQDTLSEYRIESIAVRKGGHSYNDFELPFICSIQQVDWPDAAFTIVTNLDNDRIDYLNPLTKRITTITIAQFQSIDKGIIMLINGSKAVDEINLRQNLVKERNEFLFANLPLVLAFISLFSCGWYILTHYAPYQSWIHLSYLLSACIGVFISLLLIRYEFDEDNHLLKQVCGKGSKKVNCKAVISSSHSSLFGISWPTWGGAYFCMLLLVQLLFINNFAFLVVTAFLSFLAVPYVFYSIFIQWRIIKQWCPLCLGIQAVLLFNALIAIHVFSQFTIDYKFYSFQSYSFVITLLIGAFMFSLITALVPMLKSARDSKALERNLRVIKSDENVFNYFLNKSEPLKYPIDNLGIIIGNPAAANEIIKVCNPYCSYCSDMHLKLERLIKNNSNIRLRIIFTVSTEKNDIGRKVVGHFLAIQQKYGNELVHSAFNDWYSSLYKDYETFAGRFVVGSEIDGQEDKIIAMGNWVGSMKIRATPTLFFNGYAFPSEYKVDDLIDVLKK
ncbi:putative membrane protein [Pedobacter cryoconitis]|uniref:Putative membrane protein n=1 Tax=Pedobacter cryoconitis TaxID=188932 RepID=A0A7W8YS07_9SPHI|nr:vitamin K epoxide reductase family protein [Pedobacter cryoconitis]MBB5620729.1 putative membrane protein [Pedobacter cryoconitis]